MSVLEALVLGIVQGLSEFIPVSSSGHLVLLHSAFGNDSSLAFDVALHAGTLLALLLFFWRDIISIARSLFVRTKDTYLAYMLIFATIPAVVGGYFLQSYAESTFRSSVLVACNLIVVALLMLAAEWHYKRVAAPTKLRDTRIGQALVVGIAQTAALVPGVSRSGSTITAGLFAGMDRVAAMRFSFLLSAPIIFGALLKTMVVSDGLGNISGQLPVFLIGVVAAFVSGWLAIRFLLAYLSKHTLAIFAYYRIALGILVLALTLL